MEYRIAEKNPDICLTLTFQANVRIFFLMSDVLFLPLRHEAFQYHQQCDGLDGIPNRSLHLLLNH
jgi:hypothetical protein